MACARGWLMRVRSGCILYLNNVLREMITELHDVGWQRLSGLSIRSTVLLSHLTPRLASGLTCGPLCTVGFDLADRLLRCVDQFLQHPEDILLPQRNKVLKGILAGGAVQIIQQFKEIAQAIPVIYQLKVVRVGIGYDVVHQVIPRHIAQCVLCDRCRSVDHQASMFRKTKGT